MNLELNISIMEICGHLQITLKVILYLTNNKTTLITKRQRLADNACKLIIL